MPHNILNVVAAIEYPSSNHKEAVTVNTRPQFHVVRMMNFGM